MTEKDYRELVELQRAEIVRLQEENTSLKNEIKEKTEKHNRIINNLKESEKEIAVWDLVAQITEKTFYISRKKEKIKVVKLETVKDIARKTAKNRFW